MPLKINSYNDNMQYSDKEYSDEKIQMNNQINQQLSWIRKNVF